MVRTRSRYINTAVTTVRRHLFASEVVFVSDSDSSDSESILSPSTAKRASVRKGESAPPSKRARNTTRPVDGEALFDESEKTAPVVFSPEQWADRKISECTTLPLDWLKLLNEQVLLSTISDNNWESMVDYTDKVYPDLVRDFYKSLTVTEALDVMAKVRGVFIVFDENKLGEILGVPTVGEVPYHSYKELTAEMIQELRDTVSKLTGEDEVDKLVLPHQSLAPVYKIWAEFVRRILVPRGQKRGESNSKEIRLIQSVSNGATINFARLMILHMQHARSDPTHYLPYGMLLTRIFKHFGVLLADAVCDETLCKVWDDKFLKRLNIVLVDGVYCFVGKKEGFNKGPLLEGIRDPDTAGPSSQNDNDVRDAVLRLVETVTSGETLRMELLSAILKEVKRGNYLQEQFQVMLKDRFDVFEQLLRQTTPTSGGDVSPCTPLSADNPIPLATAPPMDNPADNPSV